MSIERSWERTDPMMVIAAGGEVELYDVAVIGGGLAGLTLSVSLAKSGYRVVLTEKEKYPFHRVCGEYISLESWDFLEALGVSLRDFNLPLIKKLVVTAPDGTILKQALPLGGFGISRYLVDQELAGLALRTGVHLLEETKVSDVRYAKSVFTLKCPGREIRARVVCGTFGKRSNLDIRWQRPFVQRKANKLNNYVGIKYHIRIDAPADTIALHNFKNGYCGMSRVEDGKYCLCYLTTASNLDEWDHSIEKLEHNVLQKNPWLKKIFEHSEILYQSPLTISQISFEKKSLIEKHVLMVGDASGMITPLCGNGMSMAMHGAKIASELIGRYLSGQINRQQLEQDYVSQWNKTFNKRLAAGRWMQKVFGRAWITNIFIRVIKPFPWLVSYLIRQTHGEPF